MVNSDLAADALRRRGQALEDEFFRRVDDKLRRQLRARLQLEQAREHLASASGIEDQELLDQLLDANVSASSLPALMLVPILFVAWSDGNVSSAERQAIIHAALVRGVKKQPDAFALVEGWLTTRPDELLWELWRQYFEVMRQTLSPTHAKALQGEILQFATKVAEASGGYFGRYKVSESERIVLDQIADAVFVE